MDQLKQPRRRLHLAPFPRAAATCLRILAPGPHLKILVHMRGAPSLGERNLAMRDGESDQDGVITESAASAKGAARPPSAMRATASSTAKQAASG